LARLDEPDQFFREFHRVFNSFDLGKGKRDPSIFEDVAEALGLEPEQVLFIDDLPDNVERARERGLKAWLCRGEEALLQYLRREFGGVFR
jgi:putative hydrolase of the HAD superfamily